VLLVTDGPPGGDCTFTGCVPSKTLLAAARDGLGFDDAMARVRATVAEVAATETADVLRERGITVIEDRARLATHDSIVVGERRISAGRIIIATGARPSLPPIKGLDGTAHLTSDTVFELATRPGSMAIVGGGAIGCELAQAFAGLGVQVHLLEALDRLLGREEPEAGEIVARVLRDQGVEVAVGAEIRSVAEVTDGSGGICLTTEGGALTVDQMLVATGRDPSARGLGLEELGVKLDGRGHVIVDHRMATKVRGVYAAGDVTGRLPFTHAADEMGRLAAGNALGKGQRSAFRARWIPWVTFTEPEVGRVGMTEAEAAGHGGRVAYLPLGELDRAITDGRTDGYIKLVAGPKRVTRRMFGGRIIGATIVAPRAGEMIHEPALAMRAGMFVGRLAQTVHAYPTWSMGIQQAAAQFFGDVDGRTARPARS
jgi:pyruvate/2-oxoglutarate dehydrogenase complex dihydrolipoamide dehydrogenase (E3) component